MNLTLHQFKKLKNLYNRAVTNGKESFIFENQVILTSYAKYLIEYLNSIHQV